jgi:citrate synthase
MKKLAVFGLVAGVVLAVTLLVRKSQSSGSPEEREAQRVEKRRAMFEKMQAGMEAMPEDFPPVAMFNNVAATRENSERILELLEEDRSGTEEPVVSPAK